MKYLKTIQETSDGRTITRAWKWNPESRFQCVEVKLVSAREFPPRPACAEIDSFALDYADDADEITQGEFFEIYMMASEIILAAISAGESKIIEI